MTGHLSKIFRVFVKTDPASNFWSVFMVRLQRFGYVSGKTHENSENSSFGYRDVLLSLDFKLNLGPNKT